MAFAPLVIVSRHGAQLAFIGIFCGFARARLERNQDLRNQQVAIRDTMLGAEPRNLLICPHEVSNLIKDITVTHCAQHFLGVRVGNGVLELSANRAASSTFERNRCYIVCDTHPSFMAFVVRYQSITNSDTSDDGGFPALVSN